MPKKKEKKKSPYYYTCWCGKTTTTGQFCCEDHEKNPPRCYTKSGHGKGGGSYYESVC